MTFQQLNLSVPILKSLGEMGYTEPTPIQQQAIPIILKQRDLIGCAQTGTGKTAAFSLPILHLMAKSKMPTGFRSIKTLVLSPTRELALQIAESFASYSKYLNLRSCVIFGGVSQVAQQEELNKGVDILIATPGRLIDLVNQNVISLDEVQFFVLDEADRMLDMGFIHDISRIVRMLPIERQTLLFSATMPNEIALLAQNILRSPQRVEVAPQSSTVDAINQYLYMVEKSDKKSLLIDLLSSTKFESVLVFSRTKYGADKIARFLNKVNISAEAIHGEKSQNARQRALLHFKDHSIKVLVATDIAARGLDIEALSHVVNYDLPEVAESYVHRIGRTGRAGRDGEAISFCSSEEMQYLHQIEKLINKRITRVEGHKYQSNEALAAQKNAQNEVALKQKEKNVWRGSKSNGDFWRRQKRKK